ncbi:MAG: hypothetical protein JW981_06615 [Anaerolineae bacterium]|nr:hypothetical protein [Anaerolineae bacterium]
MDTQSHLTATIWKLVILSLIVMSLAAACGQQSESTTVAETTTTTIPDMEATEAVAPGFITGKVHGQAPPTYPMVIYAVETTTGAWASTETPHTDGEAPYTIQVQPGSYQVFACQQDKEYCSLGYSDDDWTLTTITVASGQTVADIVIRPPSQSECGATFGVPAAPDGKFSGVVGASEECRQSILGMPQGELRPLAAEECNALSGALMQNLGFSGTTQEVPFEDYLNQKTGTACQTLITFESQYADNLGSVESTSRAAIEALGWQEDPMYAGGGAGGMIYGYRKDAGLCLMVVSIGPVDMSLCATNEIFASCMERLSPEQKVYSVELKCAQDPTVESATLPKTEPTRIAFESGAISSQLTGKLAAGGLHQYVLNAAEGQEMTVKLISTSGAALPAESAILIIWGLDGTVLISDHAGATHWVGGLPLTQDYFIDVRSVGQQTVDYVLEVTIPPAKATTEAVSGMPRVIPPEFELYMQALLLSEVPPMLPPEFPVAENLPAIYPYIFTMATGEYELSLDYGEDCQGAGACHYGSMSGKQTTSTEPVGTSTIPFDITEARTVTLDNGITGYFSEAVCMANCSDATVYWIYNGYQYMIGLKGGTEAAVVELANAAILNFRP